MKKMIFLAAMAFAAGAWAQAQSPAPAPELKKDAAKPAAKAARVAKKSRRSEDARHCLSRGDNTSIIKCAEEYL